MTVKRNNGVNTCFTDCVAFVLALHPARVPFFVGHENWFRFTQKWFRKRGFDIRYWPYDPKLLKRGKYYIVQGLSPRSKAKTRNPNDGRAIQHAVIYKGAKPHWNPAGRQKFLRGKPYGFYTVKKLSTPSPGYKS